jgi:carbonic anhydrase
MFSILIISLIIIKESASLMPTSSRFTSLKSRMFMSDIQNPENPAPENPAGYYRPGPRDIDYFNRPGPWDDKNLGSLLSANKAWAQRMVTEEPDFFEEIKRGHAPKILWIGCSDARVPANEIIGQPPGAVFVHRNIANMVGNTDFNCMSVIQYAVDILEVKHIIVCGHYDCGGVKAALEAIDHRSPLENWLRNIRDTYRLHRVELNGIASGVERQRRLVELNVIEQVTKLVVILMSHFITHRAID